MYILSLCDVEEVKQIMEIISLLIGFIKIIVPIILIVSGMITLMMDIKGGNEDALAKSKKVLINKVIAAVVIFFIPTLVDLIIMLASGNTDYKSCLDIAYVQTENVSGYTSNTSYNSNENSYNGTYNYKDRENNEININRNETIKKVNKQISGVYYLGDSRTIGLKSAFDNNESAIAFDGANYTNFITDSSTLKNKLYNKDETYNVVLNYGVNDLYNVEKYCSGYNSLANEMSDHNFYVVSVNPVDDSKTVNINNQDINEFNDKIKTCISNVSNIKYCDVSSKATSSAWNNYLSSGTNYTTDGYNFIHSKIKECMK